MNDLQEIPVQEQQIEPIAFTELELLELIFGAVVEFKMFFIAFFMVYVVFKVVRWN